MHIERGCHSETYHMDLGCNTHAQRERERKREICINYIKRRNSVLIILDHTSKDIILTFFFLNVNNKKLTTSRFMLKHKACLFKMLTLDTMFNCLFSFEREDPSMCNFNTRARIEREIELY